MIGPTFVGPFVTPLLDKARRQMTAPLRIAGLQPADVLRVVMAAEIAAAMHWPQKSPRYATERLADLRNAAEAFYTIADEVCCIFHIEGVEGIEGVTLDDDDDGDDDRDTWSGA